MEDRNRVTSSLAVWRILSLVISATPNGYPGLGPQSSQSREKTTKSTILALTPVTRGSNRAMV
jgi:hypothetical protein